MPDYNYILLKKVPLSFFNIHAFINALILNQLKKIIKISNLIKCK